MKTEKDSGRSPQVLMLQQCRRQGSNLHFQLWKLGPQPSASASSATPALDLALFIMKTPRGESSPPRGRSCRACGHILRGEDDCDCRVRPWGFFISLNFAGEPHWCTPVEPQSLCSPPFLIGRCRDHIGSRFHRSRPGNRMPSCRVFPKAASVEVRASLPCFQSLPIIRRTAARTGVERSARVAHSAKAAFCRTALS